MGAGCGLLGLSVAAAHGVAVTVSDFRGHFDCEDEGESVMHNLSVNAARNAGLIQTHGGSVRVLELDWATPEKPTLWDATQAHAAAGSGWGCTQRPSGVEPADVVLATEVLYTEKGTALFVGTLAAWLSKPSGVCYLMNNARRTGVARFASECAARGLRVVELPSVCTPDDDSLCSTFAPPWDETDWYTFLRVTWEDDRAE